MAIEARIEVNKARLLCIILLNSILEKFVDFRHKTVKDGAQLSAEIGGRRYPCNIPCLGVTLGVVVCSKELGVARDIEKKIGI